MIGTMLYWWAFGLDGLFRLERERRLMGFIFLIVGGPFSVTALRKTTMGLVVLTFAF